MEVEAPGPRDSRWKMRVWSLLGIPSWLSRGPVPDCPSDLPRAVVMVAAAKRGECHERCSDSLGPPSILIAAQVRPIAGRSPGVARFARSYTFLMKP